MPDTSVERLLPERVLPKRWQPESRGERPNPATPPMLTVLWRGVRGICPVCGRGRIFAGWLGVAARCNACTAPLGRIRADDAPAYFTVFIVAHLVIGAQVALERSVQLSVGTEMLIFLPGTLGLVLLLIRPVKGATVGLMMKLGFIKDADEPDHA